MVIMNKIYYLSILVLILSCEKENPLNDIEISNNTQKRISEINYYDNHGIINRKDFIHYNGFGKVSEIITLGSYMGIIERKSLDEFNYLDGEVICIKKYIDGNGNWKKYKKSIMEFNSDNKLFKRVYYRYDINEWKYTNTTIYMYAKGKLTDIYEYYPQRNYLHRIAKYVGDNLIEQAYYTNSDSILAKEAKYTYEDNKRIAKVNSYGITTADGKVTYSYEVVNEYDYNNKLIKRTEIVPDRSELFPSSWVYDEFGNLQSEYLKNNIIKVRYIYENGLGNYNEVILNPYTKEIEEYPSPN